MHQLSRRTLLKTGLGAAAAAGAASVAGAGLRLPYAVRTARGADLPTGQDLKFWWWGEQEAPGLEGWLKQSVEAWQAATGNTLETTLLDTGVVISEFQNASAAMAAPDIQFFWNGIAWYKELLDPASELGGRFVDAMGRNFFFSFLICRHKSSPTSKMIFRGMTSIPWSA